MWNTDWNVVAHGAQLTVVGMGLVFLALGLVVLSMVILTHLPWLQSKGGSSKESTEGSEIPSPPVETDERARVAAIAVALALSEERPRPALPPPTGPVSAWKIQGRILQVQRW